MNIVFVPKLCTNPSHSNHELKRLRRLLKVASRRPLSHGVSSNDFRSTRDPLFYQNQPFPPRGWKEETYQNTASRTVNLLLAPSFSSLFLLPVHGSSIRFVFTVCIYGNWRGRGLLLSCADSVGRCATITDPPLRFSEPLSPAKPSFLSSPYRRGERRSTTMRNRGTLEKRWRRPRLDDDFPSEQITSSRKFVNLLYRSIRGGFNVEERIVKCYARKIRIRNIFI